MRQFAGFDLGHDAIPDETTILNFRHLLERHDLTKAVFEAVTEHLKERGDRQVTSLHEVLQEHHDR